MDQHLPFAKALFTDALCNAVDNEVIKKLTKLCDFTLWSVSLHFKAIVGGCWVSIRQGALIRGGCLIQILLVKRAIYLRVGVY